jgi:hypothetical protein
MMKDKDNKFLIPYNLIQNHFGAKDFDEIVEFFSRHLNDVVLPFDDTIDRPENSDSLPPQKEADEDDSAYFNRLRKLWGKDFQVKETHQRWKAKHLNGVLERDLKRRIFIQLKELLKSGFLRNDYIETGMPEEDCKEAREWLGQEGWAGLLEEVDGAVWKLALLLRHLLKVKPVHCLLCDAGNVGFYISDMRERLRWEDVEAFFRFDIYMHLVYEDLNKLNDVEACNHEGGSNDLEHQKDKAVSDFVNKICQLADNVYSAWNGKEVNLGGRKGSATIVIKRDELKAHVKHARSENFEDLAELCFPPQADNKQKLCKYVAQLKQMGFLGNLPKKKLAEILAPIVGLKPGTVQGIL